MSLILSIIGPESKDNLCQVTNSKLVVSIIYQYTCRPYTRNRSSAIQWLTPTLSTNHLQCVCVFGGGGGIVSLHVNNNYQTTNSS